MDPNTREVIEKSIKECISKLETLIAKKIVISNNLNNSNNYYNPLSSTSMINVNKSTNNYKKDLKDIESEIDNTFKELEIVYCQLSDIKREQQLEILKLAVEAKNRYTDDIDVMSLARDMKKFIEEL